MVSLKTSIRTAAKAPSPVIRLNGDLLIRMETMTITAIQEKITWKIWIKPFIGRFCSCCSLFSASPTVFNIALTEKINAMKK